MTTYTFAPTSSTQSFDWSNPAIWAGDVVPDDASADVIFPVITSGGSPANFFVSIASNETFPIDSLTMNSDYLSIYGTLTASQAVVSNPTSEIDVDAGTLNASSLLIDGSDLQGDGAVNVTGSVVVDSEVVGDNLTIGAGGLTVQGSLIAASGDLTVTVTSGGFTNLVGGVLTGGAYQAGDANNYTMAANVLSFDVGQVATVDAANIDVDEGGTIEFYNPSIMQYSSLQSTLQEVASGGVLSLGAGQNFQVGALNDQGAIVLNSATLTSPALTIASSGKLSGGGAVDGPVVNNGTLEAGYGGDNFTNYGGSDLTLNGNVTGSGGIVVDAIDYFYFEYQVAAGTVEINGATAQNVVFAEGEGTLVLDRPSSFTGTISASAILNGPASERPTMAVVLTGVSYGSVTGYNFADGVLAIQTTGGSFNYKFSGPYQTSDFTLSAGPQPLSTDPQTLLISVTPHVYAPTISGTVADQSLSDAEPDHPFAGVTVGATGASDTLSVTVTLSAAANGALAPSGGSPLPVTSAGYNSAAGVYTITGAAAAVTQALDTLAFTPNASGVAPGAYRSTQFSIAATDTTTNSATTTDAAASVSAFQGVTFSGGASGALLIGTPGDDVLSTTAAQAFVYGAGGQDTLTLSGPGEIVDLNAPGPYGAWGPGQGLDVIEGFVSGGDRLAIDTSVFGVAPGGYGFVSGAGSLPASAAPTFYFDTTTDYLWFDPDGTGAAPADLVAYLPGLSNLSASDLTPAQVTLAPNATLIDQTPGTTSYGEGQDETLWTTGAHETLIGGPYREQFIAQAADDVVIAGGGGAFIAGLGGNDQLFGGGSGADTFYFNSANASVDTIYNFNDSRGDNFALQGSAFAAPAGFRFTTGVGFIAGPGATAVAATATLAFDTSTNYLWFDPDGTGAASRTLMAFLPDAPVLKASDFSIA